jgi:hypothetical protein
MICMVCHARRSGGYRNAKEGCCWDCIPEEGPVDAVRPWLVKIEYGILQGVCASPHECDAPVSSTNVLSHYISDFVFECILGPRKVFLQKVATFGLTKDVIPSHLGGNIFLDHKAWLSDRKADGK